MLGSVVFPIVVVLFKVGDVATTTTCCGGSELQYFSYLVFAASFVHVFGVPGFVYNSAEKCRFIFVLHVTGRLIYHVLLFICH